MKKTLIISLILLSLPFISEAASFDKNLIISDDDMTNYKSMSLDSITHFLRNQGGILGNYTTADKDGKIKSAAEIIYNACKEYRLSPKFIITHLQKESSVVTSTSDRYIDWAMGYGVCDGCSKSDPRVIKYKGFTNQIYSAADRIRNGYLYDLATRNYTISGWGVDISKRALDGIIVTPKNQATAVLYTYTPWIGYHGGASNHGGNSLFWDIWQRWFPYVPTKYPNGTLLQSMETGTVYLIKDGKKLAFSSKTALISSYDPNKIVTTFNWVLDEYEDGPSFQFPNYTLLMSPQGSVFLYVNGKKRGLTSKQVLQNLGYNPEEIIPISWDDLNNIPDGKLITEKDTYPLGALFQLEESGAVVYLDSKGKRHPVWAREILDNNFHYYDLEMKNRNFIKQFEKGGPLKFKDGTLMATKSRASVFLIQNGQRRPFKNGRIFDKLGYKFENIVWVTPSILKIHKKGKKVKLKKNKNNNSNTNINNTIPEPEITCDSEKAVGRAEDNNKLIGR
ncbi:MAG: hypothetical protein ABID45_03600 [Patescibacteria group bacterium]